MPNILSFAGLMIFGAVLWFLRTKLGFARSVSEQYQFHSSTVSRTMESCSKIR